MPAVLRRGRVVRFDEASGLGEVEADDGGRLPFHCTQIADGSRTIPLGAEVVFVVAAGHHGRREAARLTPLDPGRLPRRGPP